MSTVTIDHRDSSTTTAQRLEVASSLDLSALTCRCCGESLSHVLVDLGVSPLCESFLPADQLRFSEAFYPLTVYICERCLLVQLPNHVSGEHIFSEYAYFSSFSTSYLEHARKNATALIERFNISQQHLVIELASNDGYLLRNFVEHGIPCLGIEPAANIAEVANRRGIPTINKFFGEQTASQLVQDGKTADLLLANNVLAHVPDLNDFVGGMKRLLAPQGTAVVEIQHLLRLLERNQFDTIYHEHFSYYTLLSMQNVLAAHDLVVFDVEEISTHGGSLRVYIRHQENHTSDISPRVAKVLAEERAAQLDVMAGYETFAAKVIETKHALLEFLIAAKRAGHSVAGYGAPGKGNTLLNYCGIRQDFLDYTVDRNPYKHGKFLPGTRIPIFPPERIAETQPDYILILPWNIKDEIVQQLAFVRDWGGKFVVPIPKLQIID